MAMDDAAFMQLMSQGVNPPDMGPQPQMPPQGAPQMGGSPWDGMSVQMKDMMFKALSKERDRQWKDRTQAPHVAEVDSMIKQMGGF